MTLPEQAILERLYRYTARGELSGVSDTLRGEVDYGYDAEGRLLKHYEARQGHSRAQFSYDAADNLAANDDAVPVTDNRLQHWQALFMKYDHWGNWSAAATDCMNSIMRMTPRTGWYPPTEPGRKGGLRRTITTTRWAAVPAKSSPPRTAPPKRASCGRATACCRSSSKPDCAVHIFMTRMKHGAHWRGWITFVTRAAVRFTGSTPT